MRNKIAFNPSLLAPVIELAAAAALIVAGGALWHHSHGLAAVTAKMQTLQDEHAADLAQIGQTREALLAAEAETQQLGAERDRQAEFDRFLMDRIQQEQKVLTATWEEQRPFVESAVRLQAEIGHLRDRLRAYRTDVIEADWQIETRRAVVTALEQEVAERRQTLGADGRTLDRAEASAGPNRPAPSAAETRRLALAENAR